MIRIGSSPSGIRLEITGSDTEYFEPDHRYSVAFERDAFILKLIPDTKNKKRGKGGRMHRIHNGLYKFVSMDVNLQANWSNLIEYPYFGISTVEKFIVRDKVDDLPHTIKLYLPEPLKPLTRTSAEIRAGTKAPVGKLIDAAFSRPSSGIGGLFPTEDPGVKVSDKTVPRGSSRVESSTRTIPGVKENIMKSTVFEDFDLSDLPDVNIRTTKEMFITVSDVALIHALRVSGLLLDIEIPKNARVTFKVPGGGDYSGDLLQVTKDYPLTISWKEQD